VKDGHDKDVGWRGLEEYPKREPTHQGATHAAMEYWVRAGLLCDRSKCRQELIQKLLPEPLSLIFVPGCGKCDIPLRLVPEPDRVVHSRFRIRAIASAAGCPAAASSS
jgi:hypothetical protein